MDGPTCWKGTTITTTHHIPHPPGATFVDDWYADGSSRYFAGQQWDIERDRGPMAVAIDGTQHRDGSFYKLIRLEENGREALIELRSEHARELGQALIAAAEEIESSELSELSQPTPVS